MTVDYLSGLLYLVALQKEIGDDEQAVKKKLNGGLCAVLVRLLKRYSFAL